MVYGHKSSDCKKMKVQFEKETQSRSNAHNIVKLCAIRDGIANCDILSCT